MGRFFGPRCIWSVFVTQRLNVWRHQVLLTARTNTTVFNLWSSAVAAKYTRDVRRQSDDVVIINN